MENYINKGKPGLGTKRPHGAKIQEYNPVIVTRDSNSMCVYSITAKIHHMCGHCQLNKGLNIFEHISIILIAKLIPRENLLKLLTRQATQDCWRRIKLAQTTLEIYFWRFR